VVLAVLFLFAPYTGLIPMPVLAGILAVVAWNMSERHHFRRILLMPRTDAGVMLATFGLTVAVDLTVAVTVGLLLAVSIFLHRMSGLTNVQALDPLADPELQPGKFEAKDIPPGVVVYSIDGPFFFGAADQFGEVMGRLGSQPKVVILRLRNVPYLDATGLNALESVIHGLRRHDCRIMLAAIQSQPLDMLQRSGFMRDVGDENVFRNTLDALHEARRLLSPPPAGAPTPAQNP